MALLCPCSRTAHISIIPITGLGGARKDYHPQWKWSCCSGTYPQSIADYHNLIYFRDQNGLYVNLYVPSEVDWARNGDTVRLVQETGYPESETTTLTVQPPRAAEFALHFRIPRWCEDAALAVNGVAQPVPCKPGTWAALRRSWNPGDRVTLRLPMRLALVPIDRQHPRRVAVVYGPVVLMRRRGAALRAPAGDPARAIRRGEGPLEFLATGQRPDPFVPFYRLKRLDTYDVFFDLEG